MSAHQKIVGNQRGFHQDLGTLRRRQHVKAPSPEAQSMSTSIKELSKKSFIVLIVVLFGMALVWIVFEFLNNWVAPEFLKLWYYAEHWPSIFPYYR